MGKWDKFEAFVAALPPEAEIKPCRWCGRCVMAGPPCCLGMELGGEIRKTFNFGRWSWALVRNEKGEVNLFRKTNGRYQIMSGTQRAARDAWSWARKKWPEYTGD